MLELKSAIVPTDWREGSRWMKVFEMLATVQNVLIDQIAVRQELAKEANELIEVSTEASLKAISLE
jgi:hypothetical protein